MNVREIEQFIAALYDHILHAPTGLPASADDEARWRAAAATVQLPDRLRETLKWYTSREDADSEIRNKALRLLFDTIQFDDIDASVNERGEVHFFADLRGSAWSSAVKAADGWDPFSDKFGPSDLRPLMELLLTEPITQEGTALVTDLLERHQPIKFRVPSRWTMQEQRRLVDAFLREGLKRTRGRQTTPIYARSEIDARIDAAATEYKAYRTRFPKVKKADLVARLADAHRLDQRALASELERQRGSSRKKAERRKRLFKGGSQS